MNRDFKFMVWDPMHNSMDGPFNLHDIASGNYPEAYDNNLLQMRDDLIFLQYTGRKDQTGQEIYEGDIVQKNFIKYEDKLTSFTSKVIKWGVEDWGCYNDIIGYFIIEKEKFGEYKKIGNIYENPKLLKNKKE